MKSKIGMVLAGLYILAFVFVCGGGGCGLAVIPFYLPWGVYMDDHFVYSLNINSDVSVILSVLINACILYFVGFGITRFRARNKIQV